MDSSSRYFRWRLRKLELGVLAGRLLRVRTTVIINGVVIDRISWKLPRLVRSRSSRIMLQTVKNGSRSGHVAGTRSANQSISTRDLLLVIVKESEGTNRCPPAKRPGSCRTRGAAALAIASAGSYSPVGLSEPWVTTSKRLFSPCCWVKKSRPSWTFGAWRPKRPLTEESPSE